MRNPNHLSTADGSTPDVIKLSCIPDFDIEDYDLNDDKELFKYFKDIERVCRSSMEYKSMVSYLRNNMNMNQCSFYKNVSNVNSFKIGIHIHHEPFDLFSIVQIVYKKRCEYHESLDVEMVAKEVMFLHYKLWIGLIPLAETPHELVHNKALFIPIDRVLGDYQAFAEAYWQFFDELQQKTFNDLCEATKDYNEHVEKEKQNMKILEKGYVYIDASGVWDLPDYQTVLTAIRTRIDEIKNDNDNSHQQINNTKV
jgi:hypothetical protein